MTHLLTTIKRSALSLFSTVPTRNITYTFLPQHTTVATVPAIASEDALAKEKSMYSASPAFVEQHGGPIAKSILHTIPNDYYRTAQKLGLFPNIDIRVHNFEKPLVTVPGLTLYPAIPGLHCDGEFRETYFGQPNLDRVPVSYHLIATVASKAAISRPRFLQNPVHIDVHDPSFAQDVTLWEKVHNAAMKIPDLRYYDMPDGALTQFDARSLHEVMPVNFAGSRMFFRCSMWHRPNLGEGQLSLTEQLYTVFDPAATEKPTPGQEIAISISPEYRLVGTTTPTYSIGELANEQGMLEATIPFIQKHGGPILRSLVGTMPQQFYSAAYQLGRKPVVDFLIYRPYPSYIANVPGDDGEIRLAGWNLPVAKSQTGAASAPEVHISLSSHPSMVSGTEFFIPSNAVLGIQNATNSLCFWHHFNQKIAGSVTPASTISPKDGEVVMVSSHTPRRETAAVNRGWRAILRAHIQEPGRENFADRLVKQQYMQVPYQAKGW